MTTLIVLNAEKVLVYHISEPGNKPRARVIFELSVKRRESVVGGLVRYKSGLLPSLPYRVKRDFKISLHKRLLPGFSLLGQ